MAETLGARAGQRGSSKDYAERICKFRDPGARPAVHRALRLSVYLKRTLTVGFPGRPS